MKQKRWYHSVTKVFDRKPVPETRGIGGAIARKSSDSNFGSYFKPVLARAGIQRSLADFSQEVLNTLSDDQVRNLIKRGSPIVAKALADYSDAIASGYTWTADKTLGQHPNIPQQALLQEFLNRLEENKTPLEQIIGELGREMFSHGGAFTELVIDEDGRTPIELKTLASATARFRRAYDEIRGEYYELGQDLGFGTPRVMFPGSTSIGAVNFVSFEDDPTIQYRPIGSEANNPYGTPILDPAVFHATIMAGFFDKFEQAITGFIWPNVMISIDPVLFKQAVGELPPDQLQQKLTEAFTQIRDQVSKLKPGDAIIQSNAVSIQGTLNGQGRSPLGSIKDVQDVIRRELIVAVQSQPILMASNEAIAETHAIEQRKQYAVLIRRGHKVLNPLFTGYFNLILRLNNYPPLADFKLHYVSTADYKDQAATYSSFREGLLRGSEDLIKFIEALDAAVASGYITSEQAQEMFNEGLEIRRQLNILPQDL